MKEFEKNRIIRQLEHHGVTNTASLDADSLLELYKKTITEWTNNIVSYNNGDKGTKAINMYEIEVNIKDEILNASDFYQSFGEMLKKYPYSWILDAVINNIDTSLLEKLLLILDIKYRQYQEMLIELIESKITFMPKEEATSFIGFIEIHRDETDMLKVILRQLEDTKIAKDIDLITNIKKYIISHFMPQDLEKNYKQFYNNSQDKQELVERLKKISNAYSKRQLDDMTKEDLMEILNSIRQKEINEKKDKEDFDKYIALFKQALYADDTDMFNSLVVQVIEDVSIDCLTNLKAHLKNADPLFDSKFQSAQKEWSKFK